MLRHKNSTFIENEAEVVKDARTLQAKFEESTRTLQAEFAVQDKMARDEMLEAKIQKGNSLYPFSELVKLSADDNSLGKHDEHPITSVLGDEVHIPTE